MTKEINRKVYLPVIIFLTAALFNNAAAEEKIKGLYKIITKKKDEKEIRQEAVHLASVFNKRFVKRKVRTDQKHATHTPNLGSGSSGF